MIDALLIAIAALLFFSFTGFLYLGEEGLLGRRVECLLRYIKIGKRCKD